MDCDYQKGDFMRKSNQNSTLRVLRSKRKKEPCLKVEECRKRENMVKLLPSDYIKQISISPENVLRLNPGFNELESPIFSATPKIVVFRDFSIGNVYATTLCIQNTSKIPHQLKLVRSEDVSFNVVFKGSTLNTRLAPGMTHTYDIEFHPDETRDYFHDIVFDTDLKSFIVPVIAVGPRALLSFPDQVDMGESAVKVTKTTPILMQNIGEAPTEFTISTDNPIFSIKPPKGSIEVGEAIQIQIDFTPWKTGFSNGWVYLRYESGDIVQSMIYGEGMECDVRLFQNTISFENTYLGLSRILSIEIQNDSNYTLAFKCVKFENVERDLQEKKIQKEAVILPRNIPMGDDLSQDASNVINQRIYDDEVQLIMEQSFLYHCDHFQLFPETGEVWPRSATKVSVTFQPKEVGEISSVVFLEIAGQEKRLPVSLSGKCLGPALELNIISLDIQDVYLCSNYEYEIVCKNSGPVPGTLAFMPKDTNFGTTIDVEPPEIILGVDELKPINLIVCSYRNGNFIERADFVIKESSEIVSFVIKGNAICPLVCVENDIINFYTVSLGFNQKKEWRFRNLSHEPIDFEVTIPSDGYENVITHEDFARTQVLLKLPAYPHEFLISPMNGIIKPGKVLSINVSYTPNIERAGSVPLQIHLRKSSQAESLMVPIKFDARKASFIVEPENIFIRFCFVNFPYRRDLIVTNQSEVDGYFYIEPQEVFSDSNLLCNLSNDKGYLKPGQSIKICLKIIVTKLGEQTTTLRLQSLGFEEPIPICKLTCIGEGPVVCAEPPSIDLGEIKLIETKRCSFTLRNDSPIPAEFSLLVAKNPSMWKCEPECGELDVDESVIINVTVFLRDSGKYTDNISVFISNGRPININVSAVGVGSSIIFSPEIFPNFEMGVLLSRQDISIPIILKNEGTRHHKLSFTTESKPRQTKKATPGDVEKKKFKVVPNEVDLPPGMTQTIQCQIRWNIIETLTELWSIFATIENQTKPELLGSSTFTATFTEPLVIFDKSEFSFRLDFGYDYENIQQEDKINISNQSGCDMNAHITIEPPFLIVNECNCLTDEMDTRFLNGEPSTVKVHFPFETDNSEMKPQKFDGLMRIEYKEHKHVDKIPCRAEVNFPHLIFVPKDVDIFCEYGKSTTKIMKLINDGPLTVNYNIRLIRETLSICRLDSSDEGESEGTESDQNCLIRRPQSTQSLLCDYDQTHLMVEEIKDGSDCDNFSDGFLAIQFADFCENAQENCSTYSKISEDILDRYMEYEPKEGQINPYEEQDVCFSFNGIERVVISVDAICEIERGCSNNFHINAIADIIRCEVDDGLLDFGFNLYFEPSMKTLRVVNQCKIPLEWSMEMTSDVLQVVDGPDLLEPESESFISIERQPSIPGTFIAKIYLKVTYLKPFVIDVKWTATMPQIYLVDVPRDDKYSKFSVKYGYDAVGVLISEHAILELNHIDTRCSSMDVEHDETQMTDYELTQLLDSGWELILESEDVPRQTDIDMALERIIVKNHIKTTNNIILSYNFEDDNHEISSLPVPGYTISMKPVVVEQTSQLSIGLKNHGPEKPKIKLKKYEVKRKSPSSCFSVQLEKNIEYCNCENSYLIVNFSPKTELFVQKRTEVSYKFNLEVKWGLTIPVSITALAVFPEITVEPQVLNFDAVYLGQCREMSLLLKNEGLVDCKWKVEILDSSKDSSQCVDDSFYTCYSEDSFIPGQKAVMKVYFKPSKIGEQRKNLVVTVPLSTDPINVALVGNGIKHKIKVSKTRIEFCPMVPGTNVAAEVINIKNLNPYPIEMYWKHLGNFLETNRIIRILKHYYRSENPLIPQRKVGEEIPEEIQNFYNRLLLQMCVDSDFKSIIDSIIKDSLGDDGLRKDILESSSSGSLTSKRAKGRKSKFEIKKLKRKSQIEVEQPQSIPAYFWAIDPGEIENLLHAFVDKLHEDSNFSMTMKDPLTELLEDNSDSKENISEEGTERIRKAVIFFHGAPFTEYQETACKCAKSLNLPILNLDNLFLESIAHSTSPSASKIAEHIDNRYKELVTKFQKFVSANATAVSRTSLSSDTEKIVQVARKIPPADEFEMMDLYSSYECKLEVIEAIMYLIESTDLFGSSQIRDRSSVKSQDIHGRKQSILPGANLDHFREILDVGLSQPKFADGYILQSLNNRFIKSETMTMKILLEVSGKVENYLLITFHNSFELFERRMLSLNSAKESDQTDEGSEFDNPEKSASDATTESENNDLHIDNTHTEKQAFVNLNRKSRSEDDLRRVSKTYAVLKKKKKMSPEIDTVENMSVKSMKDINSKGDYYGHHIEQGLNEIEGLEEIQEEMEKYETNLEKLFDIIRQWESGKILSTEKFFIWFIKSNDPWNEEMYDTIVESLDSRWAEVFRKNCDTLKVCGNEVKPQLFGSRTFSVLQEYDTSLQSPLPSEIFSISSVLENTQHQRSEQIDINAESESPVSFNQISDRLTLLPHESRQFEIKFAPQEEGFFKTEFQLGLIDNASANFKIMVEGVAAIPYINLAPHSVFDRIKESRTTPYHDPTYFLDTSTYDFGNLLFLKKQGRCHRKYAQFSFKNISPVQARLTFDLSAKRFENFCMDITEVVIEPNETSIVGISACAQENGIIEDNLIITIEHNEKREKIQMRYTSSELKFEYEPKHVQFGRVLINTVENQIITLRNDSPVSLYWHLSTESEIKVKPSQGKLKHNASHEINLQLFATQLSATKTKTLNLKVFLEEADTDPIFTDVVNINAEVYEIDVIVDAKDPIDLQTLPVGTTSAESFTIKNMGPYEVNFEVKFEELEKISKGVDFGTLAKLRRDLMITPMNGVIPSKKQIEVNINYAPSIELALNNIPLFYCVINEPHKNIGEINRRAILISAISYHTRYTICPFPTVNFGSVAVKSTKTMQLIIENIGEFPLKYQLVNPSTQQLLRSNSKEKSKKGGKTTGKNSVNRDRNSMNNSIKNQNMAEKWGPFSMENTNGELDPHHKDILIVDCCSQTIGRFEENLCIVVPHSLQTEENDTLSLVANIVVADIQFENYDEMFIDSYVVDTIEDIECSEKPDEFTIFSRDSKTLHYRRICIGNSHTACIALLNTSAVSGDVSLKIVEEESLSGTFKINKDVLNIPAMSKNTFDMTFDPSSIGSFSAVLEMRINSLDDSKQIHLINLEGESCIPLIRVSGTNGTEIDSKIIDFGLSLVTQGRERGLEIQNIGQVSANVMIKVLNDPDEAFFVVEVGKTNSPQCQREVDEKGKTQLNFKITPNNTEIIKIQFTPPVMKKFESQLNILVDKNPYENVEITLLGNGFTKPVILDTLEMAEPIVPVTKKRSRESSSKGRVSRKPSVISNNQTQQIQEMSVVYKLDYGRCFLSKVHRMNFRIFNKTEDRYFRFEWNPHPNFVCTPGAGHLTPGSYKALTAMFLASEPISLSQELVNCMIEEIILKEPTNTPPWDTRLTRTSWVEKYPSSIELAKESECLCDDDIFMKKSVQESLEPDFEVVPESSQLIQLVVSANANYSDYQCPIDTINFPDTLMFQTREYHFRVENTSTVNLDFLWDLTMNEQYPVRLDHSSTVSEDNHESNLSLNLRDRKKKARLSVRIQTPMPEPADTEEIDEESDLFSSSAGLTNRSTDSWIESDNWPFQIDPVSGSLEPGESIEFTVKFMPLDVFEYKANLCCKMENLDSERNPLQISVTAKSLLPYCHFDVENSDYLSSGRRDDRLPGPPGYSMADLETRENMRVVEFRLIGAEQCHIRYLDLLNPTTEDYSFSWMKLSNELTESVTGIKCIPDTGIAEKGRRTKISFNIVPEETGLIESFWQFEIKKYNLKTLFLIVFHVVEPSISCKNTLLKLESTTVDQVRCCDFDITNHESCSLSFQIKPDSLYSEGRLQSISISPLIGTLQSNSTHKFNVVYNPTLVGKYTFNVLCEIEKLSKPVKISIVAEVIEISSKILYVDEDGQEISLNANSVRAIDIEELILNEPKTLEFQIINLGDIYFDYAWSLSLSDDSMYQLSFSDSEGRVERNTSKACYLKILATKRISMNNQLATLKIKHGPTYRLKLNASSKRSLIEFSFSNYDFGPCYLQIQDGVMHSVELEVINRQKNPCLLSCNYKHESCIKVNLNQISKALSSQSSVKIPIYFQPRHEGLFSETLTFSAKSTTFKKIITITGEGIPYKLHLRDPCDSLIDFGNVIVGASCCRKVKIMNEGRLPVEFKIVIIDFSADDNFHEPQWKNLDSQRSSLKRSQYHSKSSTSSNNTNSGLESFSNSFNTLDVEKFLEITPIAARKLKPNRELEIALKLKAIEPIKSLKVRLGLKTRQSLLPFLTVKGECIGANFTLNRNYISFGTIYEGDMTEEKVVLVNNGDIGSKFTWELKDMKPHFKIRPVKGYCSAHSEIVFTCTFEAVYPESCIEKNITMLLKEYANLNLKITGNCLPLPEALETIEFAATVPELQIKKLEIHNDSDQLWSIKPKILGECFTTDQYVAVDPKSMKTVDVTYKPNKILKEDDFDVGKLVLYLPDGRQPIVRNLRGFSNLNNVAEKIIRKIPAQKKFIETLIITNRSNHLSTFDCKIDRLRNGSKEETSIFQIKVPPGEKAANEFPFYFEDEGTHQYKITFDDHRHNHQEYEIEFEVTKPEPRTLICLTTYVRSTVFHKLRIENLSKSSGSNFKAIIDHEDVIIHGLPTYLEPLAYTNVQLEYMPLLPCNTQATLIVTSEELDKTYYDVQLIAKPAPPAKSVIVKSSLGNSTNFTVSLKNYSREPCEFVVTADEPSFTCPKNIILSANQGAVLDVCFTPHSLKPVNATIKANSVTAGEFIFPVIGKSSLPQPQGPYIVDLGVATVILFKNVFLERREFEFKLDNDSFAVHETKASIDSKQSFNIRVELKNRRKSTYQTSTAKLTIFCTDKELSHIKWTYYLKAA
ncbi:hypothetical protein QAD02_019209 [Eretmocerus hayati]|uniref:Uncharacterized protein n=1 Tax=Eretmocerus hayati TaxID=131215 RepID=A0ACC2PIY2_9HYME|nr:hypothetical protein QAD02_019209 [Eretmocerus hayati]